MRRHRAHSVVRAGEQAVSSGRGILRGPHSLVGEIWSRLIGRTRSAARLPARNVDSLEVFCHLRDLDRVEAVGVAREGQIRYAEGEGPRRHSDSRSIGVRGCLVLCVLTEELVELLALDIRRVVERDGPPLADDLLSSVGADEAFEAR